MRKSTRALLAVITLSLGGSAQASGESPDASHSHNSALIRDLRSIAKRGALTQRELNRLIAIAKKDGVAQTASAMPPVRCSTADRMGALRWAHAHGAKLISLKRPAFAGFIQSESLEIRVHYEDISQLRTAKWILKTAERAWAHQVDTLQYRAPFTDNEQGNPVVGQWFYIGDAGDDAGAYTEPLSDIPSTTISDCSSRIVVNNTTAYEAIEETVYHELNHATQMATDCTEAISAFENFTTAAEHLAFPDSLAFTMGFLPEFQRYPEYPLDYWTQSSSPGEPSALYQYGAALFPIFLHDRFGNKAPEALREIWESFAQEGTVEMMPWGITCDKGNHPNWFEGLDKYLKAHGSDFRTAFAEFSAWRAIVGARDDKAHFLFGANYDNPQMAGAHSKLPASGSSTVREYGSQYIPLFTAGYQNFLHAKIVGAPESTWAASLLLRRKGKDVERVIVPFKDATGEITVPSLSGVSEVVLVVSQLEDESHAPDALDYDNDRAFSWSLEGAPIIDTGVPPSDASRLDASPSSPVGDAAMRSLDGSPALFEFIANENVAGGTAGCACLLATFPSSTDDPWALAPAGLFLSAILGRRRRRNPLSNA